MHYSEPILPDTLGTVNSQYHPHSVHPVRRATPRPVARADRAASATTAAVDGRSTRWDDHRRARRAELVKAAREAVHDLGPDASMADIAHHAGTSKPVFYRYFGDKLGLQSAVGQASIHFMEDALRTAILTPKTALEGLHTMITVYLRLARSSPNVYFFSTRGEHEVSQFFSRTAELVEQRAQQEFPVEDNGADQAARRYWSYAAVGFIRNAGEKWLIDMSAGRQVPSADDLAKRMSHWLVQGLNAPMTTTPRAVRVRT
ncbi:MULTISPECIES: TetR/AcrR family transcriptional regulator [Auritidibacter]|uniref:TetR/AcrR family transcriptional regulator n=1 Tax=Auritidibacter TaxID=1160973 RepID=UPI0013149C56|nr:MULTISPECIES: TetR/AcrR family transcriptional regulator [Auritidibacter]NIH70651.1 AcrR family transcriptional regulator [Auritidibacter ignavus]WGH82115.1 TetR/AcrR family transcriptional regulator [Auritidibacter ignavus]WGH91309.1 TetR/AcrR family transcriptional regulator [Auritidibacter ignavus]